MGKLPQRMITDQIFCIRQILKKKRKCNDNTLVIYRFQKVYDALRKKERVLYTILIEFDTSKEI
jgi:hypothetical protein